MVKMVDVPSRIFKIEDDVPIPPRAPSYNELYAAAKGMKIGQSIVVPRSRNGVCSNLHRNTGFKFTQRIISETEMRIWRVE